MTGRKELTGTRCCKAYSYPRRSLWLRILCHKQKYFLLHPWNMDMQKYSFRSQKIVKVRQ